jgi:hypothetical protein
VKVLEVVLAGARDDDLACCPAHLLESRRGFGEPGEPV